MWKEYRDKVQRKGLGHKFHYYLDRAAELEYVTGLVGWVNHDARERGVPEMMGHSEEFVAKYWQLRDDAKGVGSQMTG
jgi:hypothetical protein